MGVNNFSFASGTTMMQLMQCLSFIQIQTANFGFNGYDLRWNVQHTFHIRDLKLKTWILNKKG